MSQPSSPTQPSLVTTALTSAGNYILKQQLSNGCIPWHDGTYADPWDHIESAMGLTVAGHIQAAEKAYRWLAQTQNNDGSWYSQYWFDQVATKEDHYLKQTHHSAYIATGLWHYYLITGNKKWLRELLPVVQKAVDFTLSCQSEFGDISWAVNRRGVEQKDALVTACASIYKSLRCAEAIFEIFNQPHLAWQQARRALGDALTQRPERFDRTWAPKTRFAMDWFYPVFTGVLSKQAAAARIDDRWQEFVYPEIGCRCVNDEPWVTVAETAELCLALCALSRHREAEKLFQQLLWLQDDDGGFWTGYVVRDKTIWPEEKTTWTAGVMLLAADALFKLTPGSDLFG